MVWNSIFGFGIIFETIFRGIVMTEDLQQLLDRIRHEGVDKAQAEAKAIVEAARKEASDITAKAKADAAAMRKDAEKDAKAFAVRAEQQVRQAVRDVNLQVAQDLEKLVLGLLKNDVKAAMSDSKNISQWVSQAVAAYLKDGEKGIEVELGGSAAAQTAALQAELRSAAEKEGVKVTGSPAFPEGFTIRLAGGRIEQCFTTEAVTDALSRLLRPQIADLLKPAE